MINVTLELLSGSDSVLGFPFNDVGRTTPTPVFVLEPVIENVDIPISKFDHLVQGKETYGKLKDKAVLHYSLDGDITISTDSPTVEFPYGTIPIPWGSNGTRIFPYGAVTWQGTYNGSPAVSYLASHTISVSWATSSDQSRLIICYTSVHGPFSVSQFGNTVESNAGSSWNRIFAYRVSGGDVYGTFSDWSSLLGWSPDHTFSGITTTDVDDSMSLSFSGSYVSPRGPYGTESSTYDLDEIQRELEQYLHAKWVEGLRRAYTPPDGWDFGILSQECADQLNIVDENILLFVFDVAEGKRLLKELCSGRLLDLFDRSARNLNEFVNLKSRRRKSARRWVQKQLKSTVTGLSSAYLYEKYVLENNARDIGLMIKGMEKIASGGLSTRLHSRHEYPVQLGQHTATYSATMTVEVARFPEHVGGMLAELIAKTKRLGIFPELPNLYDMLAYSFVLNWFVNYGQFFSEVQKYQNVRDYFPIDYCILSEKWVVPIERGTVTFLTFGQASVDVQFRNYRRWITRELPLPPVAPPDVVGNSRRGNHLAETQALVVQRYANRAFRR